MPDLQVQPTTVVDNSSGLMSVRGVHESNETRDVNLLIQRKDGQFRLKVQPSHALESAFPDALRESDIPLTPAELWGAVQRCRDAWRTNVIDAQRNKELLFQRYWDFAADSRVLDGRLGPLALAGFELFSSIFFPVAAIADPEPYRVLTATGEALQKLTRSGSLRIRVTSDEFYAPWNLIYTGLKDKLAGSDAVKRGFWGYAHLVEHVPERGVRGTDLEVDPPVRVALYLDAQIDTKLRVVCNQAIEGELKLYEGNGALRVARSTTSKEMLESLEQLPLNAHVLYFCCHASVEGDGTRLSVDDAYLALTDAAYRIGPSRLHVWLGQNVFTNGPIVFLNACQTAQMNSLFYQGFVPAFMNRRASAFIGTQTEIPAFFAGEFARRFLRRFFAGGSQNIAGRILFDLRREFFDTHNNPLALLYSIYRGADVFLRDALSKAERGGSA
jgi:hypothetical protein